MIQEWIVLAQRPELRRGVVFLEDYDMNMARYLVQGVDVWMNTPRRPNEASGTSGMKAGMNGVLNLSILDGWWDECYDPAFGWAIPSADEPGIEKVVSRRSTAGPSRDPPNGSIGSLPSCGEGTSPCVNPATGTGPSTTAAADPPAPV